VPADIRRDGGVARMSDPEMIEGIQAAAAASVEGVNRIIHTVNEMAQMATSISAAIEEQTAATSDAARNISGVSDAAAQSGEISVEFHGDAMGLSQDATKLQETVARFLASE